jgi:hypothetical protein
MERIRTTARIATPTTSKARQRDENASNTTSISTTPISEVMKALSAPKSKNSSKATGEGQEDRPSKPSYLDMGWSILKEKDLKKVKELGYFRDMVKVRLDGDGTTPKPKSKEVVVFRSFF